MNRWYIDRRTSAPTENERTVTGMTKCKYNHDGKCHCGTSLYFSRSCKESCEDFKALTNMDNIKSMNINQLAGFISKLTIDANPKLKKRLRKKDSVEFRYAHAIAWKQWLEAEVEDDD